MKNAILVLAFGLCAAPALAQDAQADAQANALILPMIQEMIPGYHGQVVAACVVAQATPEERSAFTTAGGPSSQLGAVVTQVLARQPTIDCIEATLGG